MTSYRPVPGQTRPECRGRTDCDTAEGDLPTRHGAAASRDLLSSGALKYGDIICIEAASPTIRMCRVVNDKMGPKAKKAVDLMVWTRAQEKAVGVRRLRVYKLEVTNEALHGAR